MSAWQTRKVYKAEHAVAHYGEPLSVLHAERFIAKVKNSVWWKNRTNVAKVELYIQGDREGKDPWAGAIKESWKRGKLTLHARKLYLDNILHELAHLLVWPRPHHPTHDKYWVGCYLYLLRAWISDEYANKMEKAFIEEGVEWQIT